MRTNKYGNKKVEIDGYKFDSQAEARRYQELKLLEKAGEITNLELQPKFELVPKTLKRRAVTYTADFAYWGLDDKDPVHTCVVEDVKSPATAKDKTYIVKRNLFEYQNPDIEFREVI
jgi:hypothetical protein